MKSKSKPDGGEHPIKAAEACMREVFRLAIEMMRAGKGGPFGAIIVQDGEIIARGCNQVPSTNDPTAHAEIVAIREACRRLGSFRLEGCEIYCSCEPCPMCLGAIYWAGLDKLCYAATREEAAAAGFRDDFIYREMSLPPSKRKLPSSQMMREEALAAFAEWKAKADKIPY